MQWNIFYVDMVLLQMLNMCNIEEVQNKSLFFNFLDVFSQNFHICTLRIKPNSVRVNHFSYK